MKRVTFILGALSLAATSAAAQETESEISGGVAEPSLEMKALVESCSAHKFETIVAIEGENRGKRVRICGVEGQSDAEWLVTLKDSLEKIQADESMAPGVRNQIIAALETEIASFKAAAASPNVTVPIAATPVTIPVFSGPVEAPEATPQYSIVPPLPAPKPRAALAASIGGNSAADGAKPVVPIARPRLTIRCAMPRERFGGCDRLERESMILVRADEDIAPQTRLRFLRGGNARAEIDLGTLKKGQTLRESLPGRVCSGVMRGRVEVQVLTKGQVAETLGPYPLYCGS